MQRRRKECEGNNWVGLLLQFRKCICLHTTTCIFATNRPPSLPFSLSLCVCMSGVSWAKRKRWKKGGGKQNSLVEPQCVSVLVSPSQKMRTLSDSGRIYPVDPFRTSKISFLHFDRHSLHQESRFITLINHHLGKTNRFNRSIYPFSAATTTVNNNNHIFTRVGRALFFSWGIGN